MRSTLVIIATFVVTTLSFGPLPAADWVAAPSTYSHDRTTGARVDQFAPKRPAVSYLDANYTRSGFRHIRRSIQTKHGADHLHIEERWGAPVRPYGEWRFPYRPYSAPYDAWGPPPPLYGFYGGFGRGPFAGPGLGAGAGAGAGAGVGAGAPAPAGPVPATPPRWRPWHDGSYPDYPRQYYHFAPPTP
ncbi:MAG: hypothetical protein QGG36_28200 [Pirellulaceae bacterium]|jgi:hypothetical protein|nr:hypothetical protein [Pirellulaceae bacterium]MDP7019712.1 hypothetical protein [Pirellulaceae bacterium]